MAESVHQECRALDCSNVPTFHHQSVVIIQKEIGGFALY